MIINLIKGDCLDVIRKMDSESISCIITSPPYNLDIKYGAYKDNLPRDRYLHWMKDLAVEWKRILNSTGHLFLNIGYTNQDPWVAMDVAQQFRSVFTLQNYITWVKHIKLNRDTYGIYKPIHSDRYLSPTNESIFHFTKTGNVPVDRTSFVGEYNPRSGKYASSYTEDASENRWEADLKRRTAKDLGYEDWRDCQQLKSFQNRLQERKDAKPFVWNAAKDEGNTWYIPYTPIAKLAKEVGAKTKGTKETGRGDHPATFPEELPRRCLLMSKLMGGLVLDPFVGTGTTLVAAKRLGFDAVGIDIDDQYIRFAQHRLNQV